MKSYHLIVLIPLLFLSACITIQIAPSAPSSTPAPTLAPEIVSSPTNLPIPTCVPAQPTATASPILIPTIENTSTPTLPPTPTTQPTPQALNLAAGLSGNPISPSWSPDGKYVVFALEDKTRPEVSRLYKSLSDGSGATLLFDKNAGDFNPRLSPDGSQILFCSAAADEVGLNLFVEKLDGTGETQLTHDQASLCQVAWSPDGSQIAWISDRKEKTSHLYVMNADGSNLHLVADVDTSSDPVWSPDGQSLVFSGQDRTGSGQGLYSARADGFGYIQLIKDPSFEAGMQWSPDGNKILYQAGSSLYLINSDSSGKKQLLPQQTSLGGQAWSPDGLWIAFHAKTEDGSKIFVVSVNGASLMVYPHPGMDDLNPIWSPDGKSLIFNSHSAQAEGGALLLVNLDDFRSWVK